MGQRAQGPKTKNEKTERREGEKGKKKKIPLDDSDFWFRTEAGERQGREWEFDRLTGGKEEEELLSWVCDGKVRVESRLREWAIKRVERKEW